MTQLDIIRPQTLEEAAARFTELTGRAHDTLIEAFENEVWTEINQLLTLYNIMPFGEVVRSMFMQARADLVADMESALGHLAMHYVKGDWEMHDHAPQNPQDELDQLDT